MRAWTNDEIERLKRLYPHEKAKDVAQILSRTEMSINRKACRLRILKRKTSRTLWTEEEIATLKAEFATTPKNELHKKLQRHSWWGIKHKARLFDMARTLEAVYPAHVLDLTEAQKGYLAGFLDGEGCIYITPQKLIVISLYNSSEKAMEYLKQLIPFGYCHKTIRRGLKPEYAFRISRLSDCHVFLTTLMPYLVIKRDKAIAVINGFNSTVPGRNFMPSPS